MRISIFGTGYVGLVTGACLANLGHDILCVDVDQERISDLQAGKMPFFEPGLKEFVEKNREKGRLRFTTSAEGGVQFGEVIFNCVGTPEKGSGSAELKYVYEVTEAVAKYSEESKIMIIKSTVPPGTAKRCSEIIREVNPDSLVEVVSNPEFLREGHAVRAFRYPDKIVVGANSERAFRILRRVYSGRLRMYLPIVETDWETAELIKYANNTFLATKISFINEIANICDHVGADVGVIAMALGLDQRIAPKFLSAGVGYGGSCFPKDVKAIVSTAREHNYVPKLFEEVIALNERQKKRIVERILKVYNNDINGKTFCVFGLSFKPKTDDMREAPSLTVIEELIRNGAIIQAFDPIAMDEARKIFGDKVKYASSIEEAVKNSSAIIVLTEWDDFRNLNLSELKKSMVDCKLFDGRNIYEPELAKEEGFEYYGMGRQ
jgi:UDPglucose 6-dehydrogenase